MKTIQVPFGFHPDPIGGTEVYVEALAHGLKARGVQIVIAAASQREATYLYHGLSVRRFETDPSLDLSGLYGEGDAKAADRFGRILDEEQPSLVHLHAFTSGASLRLVRQAKKRGLPVVFTYHTPTVSCTRGTLMRWGIEVCDGVLRLDLCTRCTLHGLRLPRVLTEVVGRVPSSAGSLLGQVGFSGKIWTALRMRELIAARHAAVRALLSEVDHVVAVCDWVRDLLVRNGLPASKITLCPQGLAQAGDVEFRSLKSEFNSQLPLRVAFLGRLDPIKGVHLLIQALRRVPALPVTLDVYGIVQSVSDASHLQHLKRLAAGDSRVIFREPVDADQVVRTLQGYDLLAIPSQWLETGPLVILEAFAAGIPVIGSRWGGIAELVEHEVNGLLVEPASPDAWARQVQRLCEDKQLIARLRANVRFPRTMDAVAEEMCILYKGLLRNN